MQAASPAPSTLPKPIALKRGPGRLQKLDFHQELVDEVAKLAEAGCTDSEICQRINVSISTLWTWRKLHPDFAEAFKMAKTLPDDRVEGTLYRVALGYDYTEQQAIKVKTGEHTEEVQVVDVVKHQPPSEPSLRFWLKNRRPEQWRERNDVNLSGGVDVNVKADPKALAIAMLATIRAALEAGEAPPMIEGEKA